jgi:hypothetical protein
LEEHTQADCVAEFTFDVQLTGCKVVVATVDVDIVDMAVVVVVVVIVVVVVVTVVVVMVGAAVVVMVVDVVRTIVVEAAVVVNEFEIHSREKELDPVAVYPVGQVSTQAPARRYLLFRQTRHAPATSLEYSHV